MIQYFIVVGVIYEFNIFSSILFLIGGILIGRNLNERS